jgi:hypothetical protein
MLHDGKDGMIRGVDLAADHFNPIYTSVHNMSTNVYQKIFHPTLEDLIYGYEKQIQRKKDEIELLEDRILQLKHQ